MPSDSFPLSSLLSFSRPSTHSLTHSLNHSITQLIIKPLNPKGGHVQLLPAGNVLPAIDSEAAEVKASVRTHFISMRLHAAAVGCGARPRRVLLTGGASTNVAIAQVVADVFGAPVVRLEGTSDSASLGAAYRAAHAIACLRRGRVTLAEVLDEAGVGKEHFVPMLMAEPREEAFKAFTAALPLVEQAEKILASKFV